MHLHGRLGEWHSFLPALSEPILFGPCKKAQCRAGCPQNSRRDEPYAMAQCARRSS